MTAPTSVRVIGVHRYLPSAAVFDATLDALYGSDLNASDRDQARLQVMEHFAGLHVLEIEVIPSADELDWSEITQRIAGAPTSNWQAPYDERSLSDDGTRWAFFFHFLDCRKPLLTPCGAV
jgi:hypothetical protein